MKQVEEMAEIIGALRFHNTSDYIAERLYNAGYRKQSEVAREIVTEFANMLKCHSFYMTDCYGEVNENVITVKTIIDVETELKNKYTEGKKMT